MLTKDIVNLMEKVAPLDLKESFDNIGLLIGCDDFKVNKILLALDVNDEVIDEAIKEKCNLIISHHPIIFKSIKNINNNSVLGKKIIKLIKNDISVYSSHTNLDSCSVGTNDVLFDLLDLKNKGVLIKNENYENCGLGRIGETKRDFTLKEFIEYIKEKLKLNTLVYCDDNNGLEKTIKKVGLCTGSASSYDFISNAKKLGCDVYITGDLTFHNAQLAKELNIALIDGTHYGTEVIVLNSLKAYLNKECNLEVIISKVDGQTIKML